MAELTLGSLFDGIGGWPLSGSEYGIKTLWTSEIDDYPAAVSHHHFPEAKQLGDITKIDVDTLEPVDIICAGSPCQDLSVAGKRAGLEGERSGLFHTAIRLVHELRKRTGKPRYFVWENVPGAFSSNKGLDFRAVLEEITEAEIPMPPSNRWAESGMVQWGGGQVRLRGGHLMLSIGVSPREEKESFLSQILQEQVPDKYYLSQRACMGILRRAKERGKVLPPMLEQALKAQCGMATNTEITGGVTQ
jgi:hypothetical protein